MIIAFIAIRILFILCMILIIGYVFGKFSTSKRLSTLTKVASILLIVLFVATTAWGFRFRNRHYMHFNTSCYDSAVDHHYPRH